ncbi:MAG TPA: translocation/assembly module TamB domain-containing protein [Vicinamibacterales bacterium]
MRRRLALFLVAAVLLVAAATLLVHAPFVRARVLRYAVATVQAQYGIRVDASRLDYNLAGLRIGLADVRISAQGKQPPLFEADYVAVTVPRRTLFGDVALDDVAVTNGVVRIVRSAAAETNLPDSTAAGEGEPAPLRFGHLLLSPLRVDVRDEVARFALTIPGAVVELAADDGRIAVTGPATLSVGDQGTHVTSLAGRARFDGRTLHLAGMEVQAEEGRVRVDGALTVIAAAPALDLRVDGAAEVARLARWGMAEAEAPRGTLTFAGRVAGPLAGPTAELEINAPRIATPQIALVNVAASANVTPDLLTIARAAFDIEGGRISGSAMVPLAGDDPLTARATVAARIQLGNRPTPFIPLAMPGESRLTLSSGQWRLEGEHRAGNVARTAFSLSGRLASEIPQSTVAGDVRIPDADVQAVADALRRARLADVPADAVPAGRARAEARIEGTFSRAHVTFTAASDNLTVANPPASGPVSISGALDTGTSSGTHVTFSAVSDNVRVADPPASGPVSISGTFDTGTERYTFDSTLTDWALAPTVDMPLRGRVDAMVRGSGRAAEVMAEGAVTAREVAWENVTIGDIMATVEVDPQLAHIAATVPQFNATADARIAISKPYMTSMTAHVDRIDLVRILGMVETPIAIGGTTTLALRADGPLETWRAGSADLEVTAFEGKAGDLPVRLLEPALLRYRSERLAIDRLEAAAGETHISASGEMYAFATRSQEQGAGSLPAGIIATMSGNIGEVARTVAATGITSVPVAGGSGPVALLARVAGSLEAPLVSADLEVGPGEITLTDLPTISDLRMRTHVEDGWIDLREARGVYQGATVSGMGRAPLSLAGIPVPGAGPGEASLQASVTGITAMVLEPFLDTSAAQEISGSVDATLSASSPSLDLTAVRGELQLDRLDLRIADLPVTQRVPTRIVARDGLARVEAWDWTGQGARVSVQGQVRLEDLQAAILANGELDLRMATPFVRAAGLTTAGSLQPRLSITGALGDPRVDGDLLVTGGEMRLVAPRVIVSDLNGRAVLTRSTVNLTSMTGSINGGSLTAEGSAELGSAGQVSARIATGIRSMALEFPAGLRSELDADLRVVAATVPGQDLPDTRLEGTVTVLRGAYREPLAVVTGLLANLRAAQVATAVESGDALERLALDVRLVTDEDIIVDNNYGQFQLGADLRLIGTAAAPALSGRADLREGGQLFVGRNIYTVTSGTIDFANPAVIEPNLNLALTTRAGGVDIEVTIAGTPASPSVSLEAPSSEEVLSQVELTALLMTGRRLANLNTADAAFIGEQVLGNLSADVLGFAGRAIGLDTLRIGGVQTSGILSDSTVLTADLDPTSRLTFGKGFGSNLDVTLSQSLRDGDAQTWIVEYLPSRQIELRLVSDDDDLFSFGLRHDMSFGGARRTAAAPAVRRRADLRVTTVAIQGALVAPEARVRDLLSLAEGDRFDFGEWQRDRDRVEQFYQAQGYLTARITATRMEADAGVTLTYTVTPGPRTEIVVEGMDVPAAVMAELRQAWAESVFESFLIEEATEIVSRALAQQGYLQAKVSARMMEAVETQTLTIDAVPGPRTATVTVEIQEVEGPLREQVSAEVALRRLADRAATDPGGVGRELTEYLRTQGYLGARVTVGAPRFDGDAAVVPITVTPGEPVVIGTVGLEGVMRLTIDQLREAAALAEGVAADPAAIELARERIVGLYRREGFASVTVTARQALRSGEPRLDVTFVVAEGPRQVLAEIAVGGNQSIDTDVIERALDLTLKQPLRPEEWLQARTRVFDTGLFRRVDVSSEPLADAAAAEGMLPMRMRVTVEEWPALRARYGLLLAEERPEDNVNGRDLVPGLSADVTRRTLFGRAMTLGGAAGFQQRERLGRVFVSAPTMFGLRVGSSFVVERARRSFASDSLETDTSSAAWEQRWRVTPRINVSYAYRIEQNHTFDTEPPTDITDIPFDVLITAARLTGSGAWDTRDDPADTVRGSLLSTSLELAADGLGSDISYVRSLTQGYYFRPWRRIVFASAARVGVVKPLAGQELLSSFHFFAGGARTVRGFEEDGLSERNFFGDPVGGQGLLVLNQEVRFPVYRWVRGVGFVDFGSMSPEPKVSFRDMSMSAGFGVRLTTPFGVLRLDYGRVISSGFEFPSSGLWTFGIGQAF